MAVLPPVGASRARRPKRSAVRDRLVAVAIKAFERDGFSGASLSTICDEAGFSRGALYSNFAGKDALFLAALETNAAERVDQLFKLEGGIAGGFRSEQSIAQSTQITLPWALLFMEFVIHAAREPEMRERLRSTRRRMREYVAGKLVAAGLRAADDPELDQLAAAVMAVNNGFVIERLCDPDLSDTSVQAMLTALLAPGAPPAGRKV